jgi:hypothetical protein
MPLNYYDLDPDDRNPLDEDHNYPLPIRFFLITIAVIALLGSAIGYLLENFF